MSEASGALEALLAVQDLDTALTQLQHHRTHLPERVARADALAAVVAATATLDGVATRRMSSRRGVRRRRRWIRWRRAAR